jgi:hypothetical protein
VKPSMKRVSLVQREVCVGEGGVQGCGGSGIGIGELRLTDAGGAHAGGDLLAQRLAEGDVALLEDALEDLTSQSVMRSGMGMRGREETYDGLELGGPLLRHVCGGCLME